ncbi:MAG: tol-pal system protein YbgF [Desulfuromonadaceae bacterium]
MKYQLISYITILSLAGLSACVPMQGNQTLRADLNRVQSRVATLEQRTAGLEKDSGVNEILRRQAEQRAELDSIRIDIQSINGRIADQEQGLEQLREEMSLRQSDLELRLVKLEDRLQRRSEEGETNSGTQKTTPAPLPEGSGTVSDSVTSDTEAPQPLPTDAERQSSDGAAETLYREALELVQQDKEFSKAREKFTTFVEQYPQHSLAVNAMYWIGETLYGDKKYENAILQFQDVILMYPQHPKVPAALLKQGLAFYALGDNRNARIILEKVVDEYPESAEAQKAKERLEQWEN